MYFEELAPTIHGESANYLLHLQYLFADSSQRAFDTDFS
ncbi:predicted protein [Sclerotinia sclerotiorum 1980 UF-70]|uniref:Uncharacterized protein n=1 Tax=Sclerotinia sclerotiorum (strain ATCC 18683 / 1980 / Ss-1) TaxID=665079 RepID=A7E4X5_SCLS1|nr:predicted protein [Sclerotinia sclerotiorum 1980 UF-70]EDN90947.1 predicted protein [Sclerotinia sclerotiorum 1980 UF-70]